MINEETHSRSRINPRGKNPSGTDCDTCISGGVNSSFDGSHGFASDYQGWTLGIE